MIFRKITDIYTRVTVWFSEKQENIELALSQKKQLYVCFVDFKKAFDSINHTLLWSCLNWS